MANFCKPLGLAVGGSKDEVIDRILDFLMKPSGRGQGEERPGRCARPSTPIWHAESTSCDVHFFMNIRSGSFSRSQRSIVNASCVYFLLGPMCVCVCVVVVEV